MNAGAAVVIDGLGLVLPADAPRGDAGFEAAPLREREVLEDGAVGVAGDDDFVLFLRHPVEGFVYVVAAAGVFGGVGGVADAEALHARPDVAHEKAADPRARAGADRVNIVWGSGL